MHNVNNVKEILTMNHRDGYELIANNYLEQLNDLVEVSSKTDNPILRIVHFDKSTVLRKKPIFSNDREGYSPKFEEGDMVNFNDGWKLSGKITAGPGASSGLTFDTSDSTLWIIDFFDKYLYHYDSNGNILFDGFAIDSIAGEGIAYDSTDDTFWIIDARENIVHITKKGENIGDGFSIAQYGLTVGLGIAFDKSDDTFWVANRADHIVYHFDGLGNQLPERLSLANIPADRLGGMCYDSRDNTLWVIDKTPAVYHLNRNGEILDDGYKINNLTPGISAP